MSVETTEPPDPRLREVLLTEEQVRARVRELGEEISRDYRGRPLHLIVVLRGAALFAADLVRSLPASTTMDYLAVASYGMETRTSGVVRLVKDVEDSLDGRDVLVVEDIIDTGLTLNYLTDVLRHRGARSLEVCALLDKREARQVPCEARYVGFAVPDAYVVGYGLDCGQRYRGLPYIAILEPEETRH